MPAGVPESRAIATFYNHQPTAGNAATKTHAAVAGKTHVVMCIHAGYTTAPAAGSALTVVIGGTTVFSAAWPAADIGPQEFSFPGGLYRGENQAVVVTLAASASDVGWLNFKVV